MNKSRIEWVDYEWNPITGCKDTCAYCFGKKNAMNFSGEIAWNISRAKHYVDPETGEATELLLLEEPLRTEAGTKLTYPYGFRPTYNRHRLVTPERWKMTRTILVCAESEMFGPWIPTSVIQEIFEACANYPRHHYLFLTRHPERYLQLSEAGVLPKGDIYWYGVTVNKGSDKHISKLAAKGYHTYQVSEPLQGRTNLAAGVEWIVIGAEKGKRRGKEPIEYSWILDLLTQAAINNVPIYMSDGLPLPEYFEQKKDFPQKLREIRLGEEREKILVAKCIECCREGRKKEMVSITVNKGRDGVNRTIGQMCEECFKNFCTDHNIKQPELIQRNEKGNRYE